MQQSEELRALYIQRSDRNLGAADLCAVIARMARREGNGAKADKLLECARGLRTAARLWQKKARRVAP